MSIKVEKDIKSVVKSKCVLHNLVLKIPSTKDNIYWRGQLQNRKLVDVIWYDGVCSFCTFSGGLWENGVFIKGDWIDGEWHNGIFDGGNWKSGVWLDGLFKNGKWEDGEWEKGTWENGKWLSGFWTSGLWEKGTWYDGIWHSGVWNGGYWHIGWIYDPWLEGIDSLKFARSGDYVRSPISPARYWRGKER